MKYEIENITTVVYDLPEYVICKAYDTTEIFKLSPKREIEIYGPRFDGIDEQPFIYKLKSNEVLYEGRFGWNLHVDINTNTVINHPTVEWYGKKVIPISDSKILDPDNPFFNRYLEWEQSEEQNLEIDSPSYLLDGFEWNYSFENGDLVVVRKNWLEPYIKSLNNTISLFDYKPLDRNKDKIGIVIKCIPHMHCIHGTTFVVEVQYDDEIITTFAHAFIKYKKEI